MRSQDRNIVLYTAERSGGTGGVLLADGVVPALIQLDGVQDEVNVIRVRANCARTIRQPFVKTTPRSLSGSGHCSSDNS